jgi:tRNA(Ile)-lysidine synthase
VTSLVDPAAERIVLDALGGVLSTVPGDAAIGIAFSGGLDSTVLLDAAVRVAGPQRCIALHVHHGLSPNANRWLAHCESTARALGAGFDATYVEVRRRPGESLEAAARDARYRALDALCALHRVSMLWLAHHADDQAETVLLQLLRGAGVAGLAAMAPHRLEGTATIGRARPFLALLRAQLERYARSRELRWVEDESNADTRYARNALRHDVIPALTVHFPGFRDALARTASHAASAQRLLDDLAQIDLKAIGKDDGRSLSRRALLALDGARAANAMRWWMRASGLPVPSAARMPCASTMRARDCGFTAMPSTGKAANRASMSRGRRAHRSKRRASSCGETTKSGVCLSGGARLFSSRFLRERPESTPCPRRCLPARR